MTVQRGGGGGGGGENRDQILELLGNFGRWQLLMMAFVALEKVPATWQTLSTTFLFAEVDYICTPGGVGVGDEEVSYEEWLQLLKHQGNNHTSFERCLETVVTEDGLLTATNETCQDWTYDHSFHLKTTITDFDLVCSRDFYVSTSQSVYMVGVMIGVFAAGIVSDTFGRKSAMVVFTLMLAVSGILAAFSVSIVMFTAVRMVVGFATFALISTIYCYYMEMVGGRWKIFIGIGMQFAWALAYTLMPVLAYFVRDWNQLQLTISVPAALLLLAVVFLPESPRWLLSEGRIEDAEKALRPMVEFNKRKWPEGMRLEKVDDAPADDGASAASFFDLFRTPNLRRNTLIQFFLWFCCSFVYYGLTLNSGKLIPGDLYFNFFVSGLIEFPAYALTIIVILYCGRRWTLCLAFIVAGVPLLLTLFVHPGPTMLALACVGKFGIISAFAIVWLYATELFPTVLRQTGLGSSSTCARVGSILAPFAGRELGNMNRAIPIVMFSALSIVAAALSLVLPETSGRKLPDTLEEGEAFVMKIETKTNKDLDPKA